MNGSPIPAVPGAGSAGMGFLPANNGAFGVGARGLKDRGAVFPKRGSRFRVKLWDSLRGRYGSCLPWCCLVEPLCSFRTRD